MGLGYAVWNSRDNVVLPRPLHSHTLDPLAENQRCAGCHVEIAAEWRASQHRTAFSDPTFQHALAIEPTAFCRGCHAPEDPDATDPEGAQTLGIGCVTCHLAGDRVLAAPREGWVFPPHAVERSAAFATVAACAGCHEFSFGDDERREAPLGMQRTVTEHATSEHADKSCADCHMPKNSSGRRSHAFASTRDPQSHQRAVIASAERTSASSLRVRLRTSGVGHAYPTGDLFRRVAVTAEVLGPDYQQVASAQAFLGRRFATGRDREDRPIRVEVSDNRVGMEPGKERVVELDLGKVAVGKPITFRVTLDRVLHANDHEEATAVVPDRVVLASGEVPP